MDDGEIGWLTLGEAGLLFLAFVLTAAQSALVSVSKGRIKEQAEEKKDAYPSRFLAIRWILDRRRQVLDLLWLATTIITIVVFVQAVIIIQKAVYVSNLSKVLVLVAFTGAYLVLFQIFPRTLAFHHGEAIATFFAPFLKGITVYLGWIGKICQWASDKLVGIVGVRDEGKDEGLSEEEIRMVISKGGEEPEIQEEAKELIESIVEFGGTIVKEVMVPRIDMIAVEIKSPIKKVLDLAMEHGFSRYPVYEETVDNIVGVIFIKDLLPDITGGSIEVAIREKMHAPKYVPESKKVHELLREMQKERVPLAIVLDEYGGTEGLVTMEDLLEEIVGEITDVHEKGAPVIETLPDGSYLVDGKVNIEDVNAQLDISLPFEEFESIGGFVYGQMGKVPKEGEKAELEDVILEAARIHRQRISKVRVIKKTVAGRD